MVLEIQNLYLGSGSPIHIFCISPNPIYYTISYPVFAVDVLVRVPLSGEEGMLLADDLSIEECG